MTYEDITEIVYTIIAQMQMCGSNDHQIMQEISWECAFGDLKDEKCMSYACEIADLKLKNLEIK